MEKKTVAENDTYIQDKKPYDKRVRFNILGIKIWVLTFKGRDVPTEKYIGLSNIESLIKLLNEAYYHGMLDTISDVNRFIKRR